MGKTSQEAVVEPMYLLDTNAIIDFCNAKLPPDAKKFIGTLKPNISVVTRIELFSSTKITQQEYSRLEQFIKIVTVYDNINAEIVAQTISLRKEIKIALPDAIIAATALAYDFTLITHNTKDFNKIKSLRIIDPYKLNKV